MTIPTSGTYTHTTVLNEFQLSLPMTSGQVYGRVLSGWPLTSEGLRGVTYEPPGGGGPGDIP